MKSKKTNILIVLLVAVSVVILSRTQFIRDVEYRLYDRCLLLNQPAPKTDKIALIGIDDITLENLGRWPLPRNYYATLLNFLYYFPPLATGFDILFMEPDPVNPEADVSFGKLAGMMDTACFGYYFGTSAGRIGSEGFHPDLLSEKLVNVKGNKLHLPEAKSYELPINELHYNLGFLNAPRGKESAILKTSSKDGTIRDIPLIMRFGTDIYPSFVLQLIKNYYQIKLEDIEVIINKQVVLHLPDDKPIKIPIDRSGMMMINYTGGLSSFTTISFESILRGAQSLSKQTNTDFKPDMLKNTVTVIGVTATGIDVGQLPLKDALGPLALVHLNALRTIIERNFICRIDYKWALLLTVVSVIISAVVSVILSPLAGLLAFLVYFLAVTAFYFVMIEIGFWLPIVPAVIGCAVTYLGITCVNLINEEREKRRIKIMFGHYVSPNILEDILRSPSTLKLGGENRELTVLFSDIRSFTTYCEKRTPEEIVSILNEYLDAMTEVILNNGGTLDKYVGDEIMAVFGAPGEHMKDNHALQAVKTACAMTERLAELKEKWKLEGKEPFNIGIGVNTGIMKVGNMGSKRLFDYTVIGDEVNVGARIESLTREYDVAVIISESTYEKVKEFVKCRKLGSTLVKGKNKPVTIYELEKLL